MPLTRLAPLLGNIVRKVEATEQEAVRVKEEQELKIHSLQNKVSSLEATIQLQQEDLKRQRALHDLQIAQCKHERDHARDSLSQAHVDLQQATIQAKNDYSALQAEQEKLVAAYNTITSAFEAEIEDGNYGGQIC
ncbi:hypothetical protein WJX74_010389 [Apatococcus lobatus]|uniref:Uncharacterized protein n=1 Tax=Apatococcus lobatus TaxID=904363 RepID=A0AAW1RAL1_9CHLO